MIESVIAVVALIIGGLCGYFVFRYVINGKYKALMDTAQKDAEVLKEKKMLLLSAFMRYKTAMFSAFTPLCNNVLILSAILLAS